MGWFKSEVVVPAMIAGLLSGAGAYTAVRVDIAVLMSNQESFKEDLSAVRGLSERMVKQEDTNKFQQYQIDRLSTTAFVTGHNLQE